MDDCESLLQDVFETYMKAKPLVPQLSDAFNVFRLCSVDHYENKHSRILAELLNPKGAHGCKATFLKEFFLTSSVREYLELQTGIHDFDGRDDYESARVLTEENVENGRCDITIHYHQWCLVIENKIYARDQQLQLKRYEESFSATCERPIIFYLTLDGHPATEDSAKDVAYKCISYKKDVAAWLSACAQKAYDRPFVRESIMQYVNFVQDLSKGGGSSVNMQIVNNVVHSAGSFLAACEVAKCIQNARAEIAKRIMEALRNELKQREGTIGWVLCDDELYDFVDDSGWKRRAWQNFTLRREADDGTDFSIRCEFQTKQAVENLFIGVFSSKKTENNLVPALLEKIRRSAGTKYDYYPIDSGNGWVYGFYPKESDVRDWSDDMLSRMLNEDDRKQFAKKLADILCPMVSELSKACGECVKKGVL